MVKDDKLNQTLRGEHKIVTTGGHGVHNEPSGYYEGMKAIKVDVTDGMNDKALGVKETIVDKIENARHDVAESKHSTEGLGEKVKEAFHDMKEKIVEVGEKVMEKLPGTGHHHDKDNENEESEEKRCEKRKYERCGDRCCEGERSALELEKLAKTCEFEKCDPKKLEQNDEGLSAHVIEHAHRSNM